ncbi:MAG: bifunctional phosphoribosylaminoimidazolecarboxamide formyltransferase/IMP cyclohydrolase [Patescibacteria group bacterium]
MGLSRALISVSDKSGILPFAQALAKLKIEILSTGGTAKLLQENDIPVTLVSDMTGFPEILDGRVKTLHPKIHGGLLALRDNAAHMETLAQHGIPEIDLVVINLYPFEATAAKKGVSELDVIEQIDIGGPSMLRSSAKNFRFVTVLTDPADYGKVLEEIREHGDTTLVTRKLLARKVFTRTRMYDEEIERYLRQQLEEPELMNLHYEKVSSMRYGENPHQKAAFFKNPFNKDANITNAAVLHGKQLSFNNIVDGNSALELVKEFSRPTAAVIKHNNPCGVASAETLEEALRYAYEVDSMSAFGGVLALNRGCSISVANFIAEKKWFLEIIIAPDFAPDALEILMKNKNLRLLKTGELRPNEDSRDIKKVEGGILIQSQGGSDVTVADLKVVTKKSPTDREIQAMLFANKIVKHVHSNAIVFAKVLDDGAEVVTGIGAGQMSRVDAVFIGAHKGGANVPGSVMASDAFFPFADGVEACAKAGAVAIIQPGGSIRDDEVVARADELGLAMVTTGVRLFRH